MEIEYKYENLYAKNIRAYSCKICKMNLKSNKINFSNLRDNVHLRIHTLNIKTTIVQVLCTVYNKDHISSQILLYK